MYHINGNYNSDTFYHTIERALGQVVNMNRKGSIGVALIGYGYWGSQLFKSLSMKSDARIVVVAAKSDLTLPHHPTVRVTKIYKDAIRDHRIQAVVVATPPSIHYEITSYALIHGKHVFIEKPMVKTVEQANRLLTLVRQKRLTLLVDHTYIYAKPIQKIQELIAEGALGKIYFVESTRANLGRFSLESDVLWDLAPHDVAIANYILQKTPTAVAAYGSAHVVSNLQDRADMRLVYPNGIEAYIRTSWLSPVKERRLTIAGSKKILVYDDVAVNNEIRIYDRSVSIKRNNKQKQTSFRYTDHGVSVIRVSHKEPLLEAYTDFIKCIQTGKSPLVSGEDGRRVVHILEVAHESCRKNGILITLSYDSSR